MQACPRCGHQAAFTAIRCPGCDGLLLYGLVASPLPAGVALERATALLASIPGGPIPSDARRRLREGLPLIVGLSRHKAEEVQGSLIDLGLLPRLGPAPRGTRPLEPEPAEKGLGRWIVAAVALPLAVFGLFWLLAPPQAPTQEAAVPATPPPQAARADDPRGLYVNAAISQASFGLVLISQVRARGNEALPAGDMTLRLRDGSGTVVWTRSVSDRGARLIETTVRGQPGKQKTINDRTNLRELFLRGGERLSLEVDWQGWRGGPIPIEAPTPPPAR